MKRFFLGTAIAFGAMSVAMSGASAKDVFALVPKNMNNPFFDQARDGCKKAEAESGGKIECRYIGPGEHGGLADHGVQGGQRVSGAVRGDRRRRGGDAGVVVVAAGALVAAELPGAAPVLPGQGVSAARPLADGRCGRAGNLAVQAAGGGIAGHDGTFRCRSCSSFHF